MIGMNNKKDSKDEPSFFQRIHKFVSSAAVFALMLPSISSIGLVQAAELETEEPPIEEIAPNSETDIPEVNSEVEIGGEETEVETPVEEAAEETELITPLNDDVQTSIETTELVETTETPESISGEVTEEAVEETQEKNIAPTQEVVPREVRVLIHVNTPSNMENFVNTLENFTNYPLILTNQVTGETFRTTVRSSDSNTSNNFTLESTVHAYERGDQPSGRYTITLPQELIDLGYSLARDHSVQANFGIVGSTNLSYNAPQIDEVIGILRKNTIGYSYLEGRDLQILLESLDGTRSYSLGNRDISIPAGEYNLSIGNTPTDSRPSVVYRRGTLVNVPETEIPVTRLDSEYVGRITLDFTSDSQTHVLRIIETELEATHTVTIDPNGGTINDEYATTEVEEGESYTLPYAFTMDLFNRGHSLVNYTVEGTLLDANRNEVTEIERFRADYTPMSDVTLVANWAVTTGDFALVLFEDNDIEENIYDVQMTNVETNTSVDLPFRYIENNRISWGNEETPYGTYELSIDGYRITDADIRGWQMTREPTLNEDGTATVYLEFEEGYPANHATLDIRVEPIINTHPLSVEVRDLNGRRTDDVTIYVQNEDFNVFEGSFNEYLQWSTNEELPEGVYTITLDTPSGTYAVINDTVASQSAVPTDEENVFTIAVNEETRGNLSAVYGAFELVEREYRLGVEVRGLDGRRTDDVTVYVQNEDFNVFEGSYNEYNQWLTNEELPAGTYRITLETPDNTYAVINDSTQQYATPTDEENVFTIVLNDENLGNSSAIYGAFQLIEREYRLGVEVRDLDGRRTNEVEIVVTNTEGEVFSGSYNQYLQWLTDEELPMGQYTITLTTPEGTVAEVNDSTQQYAIPTDEENVFTINLNEENLGSSSAIYGAFRLVEVDDTDPEVPTDPEEPAEPTDPEDPEEPTDPEDPDEDDNNDTEAPEDKDDTESPDKKDDVDSEELPKMGMVTTPIGIGLASILTGLGLVVIGKKKKDEK